MAPDCIVSSHAITYNRPSLQKASLTAPEADRPTAADGRANFARYHFLDPASRDFFVDWDGGAGATVALLRAAAGREPGDRLLRELVGELSTSSSDFRTLWAAHDVRALHEGVKRLQHPTIGFIELTDQSAELSNRTRAAHNLNLYTAEPGTLHETNLALLSSWAATSEHADSEAGAADLPERVRPETE